MSINHLSLLHLPHSTTPLQQMIAWRDGQAVLNYELQTRIHAWHVLLARTTGNKFALYINDSLEFASALFGAWLAEKTIYLPNNILPATCNTLREQVDGFLGDFTSDFLPLTPSNDDAASFDANKINNKNLINDYTGLVIYTSGTTGAAQAIPKRLSQLATEIATLEKLFGDKINTAEIVATVPHEHIYGLLFKILWPLTAGRIIHVRSAVFLEELTPALTTRECVLITSPAHLNRFVEMPNTVLAAKYIRAIFSSGAPLSLATAQTAGRVFGNIPIEIYGSSETGGIAWRQRNVIETVARHCERSKAIQHLKPGLLRYARNDGKSVTGIDESWQPMPGVEWRLTENNILEIRSAHLPDNNWFRTADRAIAHNTSSDMSCQRKLASSNSDISQNLDASLRWHDNKNAEHFNRFLLQGRIDRIVKLEGKRISLDAIERCLLQSTWVAQARVLMIDENNQRHRIAAFIVPTAAGQAVLATQGKLAFNQQLRDFLTNSIERIALPRIWRYLNALPVNAQGKTTQAELIAMLANNELSTRPTLPQPRLLEQETTRAVFELTIPQDLFYFAGHFPVAPILPGVVQIDWAIYYGKQCFALPPYFRGIQTLKFQNVISPGSTVSLELLHDTAKSALQFRLYSAIGQHASGRILFSAEENT